MKELFEITLVDSPRLSWLKKHDVMTHHNKYIKAGDEDEFSGEPLSSWCAFTGGPRFPRPDAGYGDTEADAIADWAKKHNVPLWNEEGFRK